MFKNRLRSQKGFSLVEVLIASGLMALVGAGMVSVVTTMNNEQNNQTRTATLRELKSRIQFLMTDQNAWNQTLSYSANNLSCVTSSAGCSSGINKLNLMDPSGNPFMMSSAGPSPGASPYAGPYTGSGFTDKGQPCTGFSSATGAGVDSCPISFLIVWEPICSSYPCKSPLLRLTARLLYNPSGTAKVSSFALGKATGTTWTDDNTATNTGKYDVVIRRSATTVAKGFSIQVDSYWGSNTSYNTAGGACTAGSYCTRGQGVPGWRKVTTPTDSDPFNLVTISSSSGMTSDLFTVKAGTYSCKFMGVAWAADTFKIMLYVNGSASVYPGSVASGNAPSSTYGTGVATVNFVMNLSADTAFKAVQYHTGAPATNSQYAMGIPGGAYTGASSPYVYAAETVYSTLSCTQTN